MSNPTLQFQTRLFHKGKKRRFQWRVRWTDRKWTKYRGECKKHSDAEDEVLDALTLMQKRRKLKPQPAPAKAKAKAQPKSADILSLIP